MLAFSHMKDIDKMRFRKPLSIHVNETILHFDRWMRSRGSCRHFAKLPAKLMKQAILTEKALIDFSKNYQEWIKANEHCKKESYLVN